MNRITKEIILIIIASVPIVYLLTLWKELPAELPTHFNLAGEADAYSSKETTLWITISMNLGAYLLMLVVPNLDPKGKVMEMGSKYFSLRVIMQLFMAATTCYIVFAGSQGEMSNPNIILVMVGAFLALLGNYFQVLRQNYFVGIKTPWTLENETVWKKTPLLGGKLWVIGGIGISIAALLFSNQKMIMIVGGILLAIMVLVPVIYSYVLHKQLKGESAA